MMSKNNIAFASIAAVLAVLMAGNIYLYTQLVGVRRTEADTAAKLVVSEQTAAEQQALLSDLTARLTAAQASLAVAEQQPDEPSELPPLPAGQIISTSELLLEKYDPNNLEHSTGRATTANEPRTTLTLRVVDREGKPVPMLSCDYDTRRWTDAKGEVRLEALYNNPSMLTLINGKSGMNIADDTDYWVDYRLTVLEGADNPLLELTWLGVTPQQTIDTAANRIEILVTDKAGVPIKGAELWLEETFKKGELRPQIGIPPELTDENGRYIWCNYPNGSYTIYFGKHGNYTSTKLEYQGGILQMTLEI